MTELRPECKDSTKTAIPDDTALFLIRNAVAKRRSLAYGKLRDGANRCAMGCFWDDNPGKAVDSKLIDEVASVNDSVPKSASPHQRWKIVNGWLRWKLNVLAGKTTAKRP